MDTLDDLKMELILDYMKSDEYAKIHKRVEIYPRLHFYFAFLFICLITTFPIGIYLIFKGRKRRKEFRNSMLSKVADSVPVFAFPIMVNSRFLNTPGCVAGTKVLITFENQNIDFDKISKYMINLEFNDDFNLSEEERSDVDVILNDEFHIRNRRIPVPVKLTDGIQFYACDLIAVRDFMSDELEAPFFCCVAQASNEQSIYMIPDKLMGQVEAATSELERLEKILF